MRCFCLRSMQQMSEDEHGLESVSAWIETKLRVRYLIVLLTPLRHIYSQDIHIQPVHCSAHSQHAKVVWIQHRTSFMHWCYFGCLPHLRDLSFFPSSRQRSGESTRICLNSEKKHAPHFEPQHRDTCHRGHFHRARQRISQREYVHANETCSHSS